MKFFDNHNHSTFSPDSVSSVEAAIRRAMELGLAGLAITDHYDIDAPSRDQEFSFDPAEQQAEIDRVVMELGGDMLRNGFQVMKGIEVGLQPGIMDKIKSFTSSYNFDTVIASIHFVDGTDPYMGTYYGDKVFIRGLIEVSNICKNDCYYCSSNFYSSECRCNYGSR